MHNINTYIGRQPAWHQLGKVTGKFMTWNEILASGGLDFEVVKKQLQYHGEDISAWGIFRADILNRVLNSAIVSAEDFDDAFLGTVGSGYEPIQHAQGFQVIDALVNSVDGAHYETAGVLGKGEVVWGLADLQFSLHIGRDEQKGYLLFSTSHDASLSHTYRTCLTRVVCQNTLTAALGERAKAIFRVKHTRYAQNRLDAAHDALATLRDDSKSMEEKLNFLATRKVTRESATSIFDRLFPQKKDDAGKSVETTRRSNILGEILSLYEHNDGNVFPEFRGTAYNLLNAITEYTDHQRSSHGDRRSESALFGTGDKLKTQALEYITESAKGMSQIAWRTPVTTNYDSDVKFGGLLDDVLANHS